MRPRDPADSIIPLSGVTCLEFEALLEFFYNGCGPLSLLPGDISLN